MIQDSNVYTVDWRSEKWANKWCHWRMQFDFKAKWPQAATFAWISQTNRWQKASWRPLTKHVYALAILNLCLSQYVKKSRELWKEPREVVTLLLKLTVCLLSTEKKMCLSALSEEECAIFFLHHLVTVSIVRHARHFAPHFMVWSCASPTWVAVALQPVAISDIAIFHLLKKIVGWEVFMQL